MPVSKKPRKQYLQYDEKGKEPKVNHERSLAKHRGATKLLGLISRATQGDVLNVPRTVHHMLAYNRVSI